MELSVKRLPSGFGSVRYLGKGRRNPYAVHPPESSAKTTQSQSRRPPALCYVCSRETGIKILMIYHAGLYTPGVESDPDILNRLYKKAIGQSGGDYVMFLTQDALPVDKHCIENLLKGFSRPDIAGVYGRQIAWPDAAPYENLTRQFNYPDQGRVWREQDIPRYGVKSYFFSNTCSMYRRDIYEKAGGFDRPIITNEDMMMAARLIHQGYALAYVPEAAVYHSHNNTLFQDYKRNVKIGYVMRRYSDRLTGAQADSEGMRMVRFVGKELIRERHFLSLGAFCMHAAVKLAGNRAGKARRKREEKKEN